MYFLNNANAKGAFVGMNQDNKNSKLYVRDQHLTEPVSEPHNKKIVFLRNWGIPFKKYLSSSTLDTLLVGKLGTILLPTLNLTVW